MESLINKSYKILKSLQLNNHLFLASPSEKTSYRKIWIRDNLYVIYGVEAIDHNEAENIMHSLFDLMIKHENKLDSIKTIPKNINEYIHARYDPMTLDEFKENWGNNQNDAIGLFLFRAGEFLEKGINLREGEMRILNKLVKYLEIIEYWHNKDNGMWEENEEIHSSSIGSCVAGLKKISKYIEVPSDLIKKGEKQLFHQLPNESEKKDVDLSLLSLIYPYNLLDEKLKKDILSRIEKRLVKKRGVIRYVGDKYYNRNGEAEWSMGFPWLAIIYKDINKTKYDYYIKKSIEVMNEKGELPELYYSNSDESNDNTPLAWSQALFIKALKK